MNAVNDVVATIAASQTRVAARAIPLGYFLYVDGLWRTVVGSATVNGQTRLLIEGCDEAIGFHQDDDVDVCAPTTGRKATAGA